MKAAVFKDVVAGIIIHSRCGTQVWRQTLRLIQVKPEFFGKPSHASP